MKTRSKQIVGVAALAWALFVLCVVTQAFGSIVIMDAWREVGVSGTTGGSSYSESQSLSGAGVFSAEVSGEADQSNPPAPRGQLGSGHSEGVVSQESVVGPDGISVQGNMYMQSWAPTLWVGPLGTHDAAGRNLFSVTFLVEEPQAYELDFWQVLGSNRFWFDERYAYRRFDFFEFNSPLYGEVVDTSRLTSTQNFSGVLLPDVYTFSYLPSVILATDYLGDSTQVLYKLDLAVTTVPDTGSTLALLGLGLVGLIVVKRRMALV